MSVGLVESSGWCGTARSRRCAVSTGDTSNPHSGKTTDLAVNGVEEPGVRWRRGVRATIVASDRKAKRVWGR